MTTAPAAEHLPVPTEAAPLATSDPPSHEQILRLQAAMIPMQCAMPEAEHFFAPGMYGRRFAMPAGMVVVGKIHRHAHFMTVLKGRATVVTEFGREEVSAGYVSVSQPGAKRVVVAHEDTVFMTFHLNASDTQDLAQIEREHIKPEDAGTRCLMDLHRQGALQ